MIKADSGTVYLDGSVITILAEISTISNALMKHGIPEIIIRSAFETGLKEDLEEKEEKPKVERSEAKEAILEILKEMSRQEEEKHGREEQE